MKKVILVLFSLLVSSALFADDLEMVKIPGKKFEMLKTEVTQELYEYIMYENPSWMKGSDLPVESVSWYDAIYFCNKLSERVGLEPAYSVNGKTDVYSWYYTPNHGNIISGKITWNTSANGFRFPTLQEWTYAVRGGKNYKYAGGDNVDEVCWYRGNSSGVTHPVAEKKANDYGLYDMTGNVFEWCWDIFYNNSLMRCYNGGSVYKFSDFGWDSYWGDPAEEQNYAVGFRIVRNVSGNSSAWNPSKSMENAIENKINPRELFE